MKKRIFALCIALMMFVGILAGCNGDEPKTEDPSAEGVQKVALLLSGPANDQGWNAIAVAGLDALEEEHGLETAYMENVQVADMEAAYNDYASQGYDLVIGHGFQFGEPAAKVSANYPDQFFMATESNSKSPNMSSYVMACEEGAYLMGVLAAMMTETNVIGVVGGIEQPSITKEVEAFKAAAKEYNPEITVLSAYANSFTDVTAGQSAATAMINQNADVLYHVANQAGTGVINAAADNDVYVMGNSYDQSSIAPEVLLCSTVYSMPNVILQAYADTEAGIYGNAVTNLGFKEGIVDIAFNEALLDVIGEDNVAEIEQTKDDIIAGKIDVPLIETPSE